MKMGALQCAVSEAYWNRPGARNVLRNGGVSPDDKPGPADVGRTLARISHNPSLCPVDPPPCAFLHCCCLTGIHHVQLYKAPEASGGPRKLYRRRFWPGFDQPKAQIRKAFPVGRHFTVYLRSARLRVALQAGAAARRFA